MSSRRLRWRGKRQGARGLQDNGTKGLRNEKKARGKGHGASGSGFGAKTGTRGQDTENERDERPRDEGTAGPRDHWTKRLRAERGETA